MPFKVARFQETPNPNALKCVLDRPVGPPIRSYRSRDEARSDDILAAALFSVEGVTGLLISGEWITVNKDPGSPWPRVRKGVENALASLPEPRP